jgi:NADPH2:quinone reductase
MRTLILNRYNGPSDLSEVLRPKPAVGQVMVRIASSCLKPPDMKNRSGGAEHATHPLPAVLGSDIAGVVDGSQVCE